MPIIIKESTDQRLSQSELDLWKDIPTAVVCDAMDRTNGMVSDIQSLVPGRTFAGQALTVHAPNGTNAPLHHAIKLAWPGCVLIVDAENLQEKAVWGSVVNAYALSCGVNALVFDGCVRDAALLKVAPMPVFCRGTASNGPSKEDSGGVNISITCGGAAVTPGDLVVGDDDGVAVVPFAILETVFTKCRTRLDEKEDWRKKTQQGISTAELWKLTPLKSN